MIALLPLADLPLHVRVSKPVARRETVKMVHLELGSGQAMSLRDLVMLTSLSWSSWRLHAVQQILNSFTHEPPVLARQDSSLIVNVARILGRTRLIHVSSRLRALAMRRHIHARLDNAHFVRRCLAGFHALFLLYIW